MCIKQYVQCFFVCLYKWLRGWQKDVSCLCSARLNWQTNWPIGPPASWISTFLKGSSSDNRAEP